MCERDGLVQAYQLVCQPALLNSKVPVENVSRGALFLITTYDLVTHCQYEGQQMNSDEARSADDSAKGFPQR